MTFDKIHDANQSGPNYKDMMESYLDGVVGNNEPEMIWLSRRTYAGYRKAYSHFLAGMPFDRFQNAIVGQIDDVPEGEVWFINREHPECNVKLINVRLK
jgi:hypothetical protein